MGVVLRMENKLRPLFSVGKQNRSPHRTAVQFAGSCLALWARRVLHDVSAIAGSALNRSGGTTRTRNNAALPQCGHRGRERGSLLHQVGTNCLFSGCQGPAPKGRPTSAQGDALGTAPNKPRQPWRGGPPPPFNLSMRWPWRRARDCGLSCSALSGLGSFPTAGPQGVALGWIGAAPLALGRDRWFPAAWGWRWGGIGVSRR